MSDIGKWDIVADSNQVASPDGFPEGQTKPSVNNACREIMAAVARWMRDAEWVNLWLTPQHDGRTFTLSKVSDTVVRIVGSPAVDDTGYFTTNRRIKISSGGGDVYGYVSSAAYSNPNNDITVTLDSGVVPTTPTAVYLYLLESIRKSAFTAAQPLTVGRHTIGFPAAALSPRETYGCDPHDTWETTAGRPDIKGLAFPDSVAATGAIQVDDYSTLANGVDTLTINGTVYTFRTTYTSDGDIQIMGSNNAQATEIASRLNASALGTTGDCTYTANAAIVTVAHDTPGTGGNSFTLATNASTEISLSGGTLSGGTDKTYAQISIPAPKSWDGGTLQLLLGGCRRSGTGTVVKLRARARCVGAGDSFDQAFGTAQDFSNLTLTSIETRYETGELGTALTPGGTPSDNCQIELEIERDPTDASDNLDVDFILTDVRVFATLDASTDA